MQEFEAAFGVEAAFLVISTRSRARSCAVVASRAASSDLVHVNCPCREPNGADVACQSLFRLSLRRTHQQDGNSGRLGGGGESSCGKSGSDGTRRDSVGLHGHGAPERFWPDPVKVARAHPTPCEPWNGILLDMPCTPTRSRVT